MELVVAELDRPTLAGVQGRMKALINHIVATTALSVGLLHVACSGGVTPRDVPTPAPPEPTPAPREIVLPADDRSHHAPIEWWYYNGHLESEDGQEYSFHYVIFQTEDSASYTQIEFGQVGITDIRQRNHTYFSSERPISPRAANDDHEDNLLNLKLGNFDLEIAADGSHSLAARDPDGTAGLQLATETPEEVMLHEGIGWMQWPFGWTYYYSYPRMQTHGRLTLDGRSVDVKGEVWFDHQWGDFFVVGKPAGWQWFAIHLDDDRSLMISEVRGADGEIVAIDGTIVQSGSEQRVLEDVEDDIELEVLDYWTSIHTAGEYPASWRLRIDSVDLDLLMTPSIADQEVPANPYGNQAATYWEGRVDVIDPSSGEAIGLGFAELSGYVEPVPLSWREKSP